MGGQGRAGGASGLAISSTSKPRTTKLHADLQHGIGWVLLRHHPRHVWVKVRCSAGTNVGDYFQEGKRWWFRLHEKSGKRHEAPAHHKAEAYVDAYLSAAQIADDRKGPLFRSLDRERRLTARRLCRLEVLAMIKRRARQAGLPHTTCCHTFRATGITTYLQNGGTIEHAQQIANHESPRTTKLYDRTNDAISLNEIERILI